MTPSTLALSDIKIDGGTQSRAQLNADAITEYAAVIEDGVRLPPVTVYYDGAAHWLADGFHRFHATKKAGRDCIEADIRQGTRRDAVLYSVGANDNHGVRRTLDDKRRAVLVLLEDGEWSKWSDVEIAAAAKVHRKTVAKLRDSYLAKVPSMKSEERTFTHPKTGKPAAMNTSSIGKTKSLTRSFVPDADMQAEADAAARDLQIERDERIAMSGTGHLVEENEKLTKLVATLQRRVAALIKEKGAVEYREKMWKERALAAGWKGRADA